MELHQPLRDHQARCGPLASSSPLSVVDFSYSTHGYVPPLYSPHHATHFLSTPHGTTSGIELYNSIPLEETRSRKRRRISGGSPVPQSDPVSTRNYLNSSSSWSTNERHDEAPNPSSRHCVEHIMHSPHYYNLPIAKSMAATLSQMFCPCCGFDGRGLGGHQPIPEPHISEPPAAVMYDSKVPYMSEKPPLMQPPVSPGESLATDPRRRGESLSYGESPIQANHASPVFPTLTIPTATENVSNYRRDPIKYENSPVSLVRSGSRISAQESISPTSPMDADMQFSRDAKMIGVSSPSPLHSPVATASYELPPSQMSILRCEPTNNSPVEGWSAIPLAEQQPCYDLLLPRERGGKRGPFKTLDLREQTAQTRKIGSCIRCRMQRIRCENNPDDSGGDCLTCHRVTKSKAGRFPCLRYKITDIRMYKPGPVPGYEWTRRWNNNISDQIQRWASSEIKVIRLSEGYSRQYMEVRVRRFVPQEGDKLERTWDHNGSKRSVSIPPFALVDLEEGRKAYTKYIRDSMVDTFPRILGPKDGLLYKTYLEAWRLCRDPSTSLDALQLLNWTFRLWMSIRLSTASIFIVGDETLGMPRDILDDTNPNHGKIPVPPVLGAQTDVILIHHVQTKLRRELLDKLQKITLKNKQDTWMLTYLVTFMLLHNAAMIMAHDAKYARKHGMKRRFARKDEVAEYFLGANILLAHFHYCNKGLYPFSDECKDKDLKTLAALDEERIRFVHETRKYAKQHKQEWEDIKRRGLYEHDYFFISQLFEEGWQPRTME